MITVDEAKELLKVPSMTTGKEIKSSDLRKTIELLTHLQSENELQSRVIREIKEHQTGVNALKLCLTRCRELEDKQCDCKGLKLSERFAERFPVTKYDLISAENAYAWLKDQEDDGNN